jgi:hypothetical protein
LVSKQSHSNTTLKYWLQLAYKYRSPNHDHVVESGHQKFCSQRVFAHVMSWYVKVV